MIKLIEIYALLKEEKYNSVATKYAMQKILSGNYNFRLKLQTAPNRIGNLDKISSDDFINKVLIPNFSIKKSDIKIIPPGQHPNTKKDSPKGSTKYKMYEFPTEKGDARVLLSGGENDGNRFESNLREKIKSVAGIDIKDIKDPSVAKLYAALNINPKYLNAEDIKDTGKQDTKRQPGAEGPVNVGKTISDVTITYKGKEYYISIKDKSGNYFYNGPNIPFIIFDKSEKVIFDKSKYNSNPVVKLIFDLYNINPKKIADGLNDYINKTGLPGGKKSLEVNDVKGIKNLLASSLGYGYYYVREYKNDLKIIPLLTKKDALDAIGEFENVVIKYPSRSTKSTEVSALANSPLFGTIEYTVDMRNVSGQLLPLAIKIKGTPKK